MRRVLVMGALLFALCQNGNACLWDYDTLAMERQQFPEAQELIAGYFVRHSLAYYDWRIEDRTSKPIDERTPSDFDDIAVAYDKLGKHEQAIKTIRDKIERWPDEGRYESEANLGTFLIHAGRYDEGLPHIQEAIDINPDAHFGREIYQKLLVQYLIESRQEGQLPIRSDQLESGFASYVLEAQGTAEGNESEELQAAAKGVMGMMRFGKYDSPILLEALGDLLIGNVWNDSKMLAARAYLKASYEVEDSAAEEAYRVKAEQAVEMQVGWTLADIEDDLQNEIAQGNEFFRQVVADEKAWVAAGDNLDEMFAANYYNASSLNLGHPYWKAMKPTTQVAILLVVFVAVLVAIGILCWKAIRYVWRPKTA